MVQVDVVWGYAFGATFAAAAARQLEEIEDTFDNPYFTYTLAFLAILFAPSGLYLLCYGVFRFLVEFVRVPDAHIGYLGFGWLTMGHVLTLPMILFGIAFLVYAYRRRDGAISW